MSDPEVPALPGSGPIVRTAARVLMVDADGRTLLFRGFDPAVGRDAGFWFTPGGGLQPGEDVCAGAAREVAEETGHSVGVDDLVPLGVVRRNEFSFCDRDIVSTEHYLAVRAGGSAVDVAGFEPLEVATVTDHRWWSRDELARTAETVFPSDLVELLDAAVERLADRSPG